MNHGIHQQTTCIDTPQQSKLVERKHQRLLVVTRVLLFQSKLTKKIGLIPCVLLFISSICYLQNYSITNPFISSFTILILILKVFGYLASACSSKKINPNFSLDLVS